MKLFSIQMGVLAVVYFISMLAINTYFFEEEFNSKSVVKAIVSTLFFCLFIYFLNRKKTKSKDN